MKRNRGILLVSICVSITIIILTYSLMYLNSFNPITEKFEFNHKFIAIQAIVTIVVIIIEALIMGNFLRIARWLDVIRYLKNLRNDFEKSIISRCYIEPIVKLDNDHQIELTNYIEDFLANNEAKSIAILGGYGTGKTTYCEILAANLAEKRLKIGETNYIPILIKLRDWSLLDRDNIDLHTLITKLVLEKYGLNSFDYYTFMKWVEDDQFCWIIDGLDELPHSSVYDQAAGYLRQLEPLLKCKSKLILTCRTEFFSSVKVEQEVLGKKLSKIIYLELFEEHQISEFLQCYVPLMMNSEIDWEFYYNRIYGEDKIFDLEDLATRAIHLAMILEILPEIEDDFDFTVYNIYERFLRRRLSDKNLSKDILIIEDSRILMLQKLAWELFLKNKLGDKIEIIEEYIQLEESIGINLNKKEYKANLNNFLNFSLLERGSKDDDYIISNKSIRDFLVVNYISMLDEAERIERTEILWLSKPKMIRQLFPFRNLIFFRTMIKHTIPFEKKKNSDLIPIWLYFWIHLCLLDKNFQAIIPDLQYKDRFIEENILFKENGIIKILNLSNMNLEKVPSKLIEKFSSIEVLCLSSNKLTELPNEIGNLKKLRSLDISNNKLVGLPDSICNLNDLYKLDLSDNAIENIDKICNLNQLSLLNLGRNEIVLLSNEFSNLKNLIELRLFQNNLISIPISLCELSKLKILDLSFNKIETLPDEISNLVNLEDFYLFDNEITSIPKEFGKLVNLVELNLSMNYIKFLPMEFYGLENLEYLKIHSNKIRRLTEDIESLISLNTLEIAFNPIRYLPLALCKLTNLNELDIREVQLNDQMNMVLSILEKKGVTILKEKLF